MNASLFGDEIENELYSMNILSQNFQGALYGGLVGLFFTAIVIAKAQNAVASDQITFPKKVTSIDGCDYVFNSSVIATPSLTPETR